MNVLDRDFQPVSPNTVAGSEADQMIRNAKLRFDILLEKKPRWQPPKALVAVALKTSPATDAKVRAAVE